MEEIIQITREVFGNTAICNYIGFAAGVVVGAGVILYEGYRQRGAERRLIEQRRKESKLANS